VSRRFRVGIRVTNVHIYDVEIDGTADPEAAPPDWVTLTENLVPVEVNYGEVRVAWAHEVKPSGQ